MKTQPNMTITHSRRQAGVGMVEVLIALLVLSIGVLGYAGLQLRALQSTGEAHFRTQAMAIAQDITERIGVNAEGRAVYEDDASWDQADLGKALPGNWDQCINAACTADQVAAWDILQARWTAERLLPNGRVLAQRCPAAGALTLCVTVAWNDEVAADCEPGDDNCVVLEVVE